MSALSKQMKIKYKYIKFSAYIFALLPVLLFFAGWLKWYFFLIGVLACSICFYFAFAKWNRTEEEECFSFTIGQLLVLFLIAFAFAYFCGIGRLWAQSKDYPWRNAIFRDLILKDWPVFYPKYNGALDYYIGLWLPAAFTGKMFNIIGFGNEASFFAGNIALLIYVTFGLFILFLLLSFYFKRSSFKTTILIALMFIFFSGMDILGSIEPLGANNYHLEWWAHTYQYSSFTTCMCWVFNQSLIPWIITLLVVKDKKIEEFVFLGMMCLLSGPFPFVGLFVFCVAIGLIELVSCIKTKSVGTLIKRVFSVSNICAAIAVFPFIGLYYLANSAITGGGYVNVTNVISDSSSIAESGNASLISPELFKTYILFCLVEFLIYAVLILNKYYKKPLYWVTVCSLFVFPFVKMGYSSDFCMRASIPLIFVLFLLCTSYILEEKSNALKRQEINIEEIKNNKKDYYISTLKKYLYIFLCICLLLGAFTPLVEFIRGFRQVSMRGINDVVTDYIVTFDGTGGLGLEKEFSGYEYANFVSVNKDEKVFFKYICK